MIARDDIISEARGWLEVPWRHQGRTRHGIDCAGLVIKVANDLGISQYDTTAYQRRTSGHEFMDHFNSNMKKKRVSSAEPGDVLLFRDDMFPCHSAIIGIKPEGLTIIHAYANRKKVVEEPYTGEWVNKVIACFEYTVAEVK